MERRPLPDQHNGTLARGRDSLHNGRPVQDQGHVVGDGVEEPVLRRPLEFHPLK